MLKGKVAVHAAYRRMMDAEDKHTHALKEAFGRKALSYRYELSKRVEWPAALKASYDVLRKSAEDYLSACKAVST